MKSAGWCPSGLHIGVVDGVELRPENLTFFAQCGDREFLLATCMRIVAHKLKGVLRIRRSLVEPGREVVKSTRQPRIMLAQRPYSQRDQISRKQLCQR